MEMAIAPEVPAFYLKASNLFPTTPLPLPSDLFTGFQFGLANAAIAFSYDDNLKLTTEMIPAQKDYGVMPDTILGDSYLSGSVVRVLCMLLRECVVFG